MATFTIEGEDLVLQFGSFERIAGLRRGARVALDAIAEVSVDTRPWSSVRGLRVGTGLPYVALIGTMLRSGANDVVALRGRGPAVMVRLCPGAPWQRLMATAPSLRDAEHTVAMIRNALDARAGAGADV